MIGVSEFTAREALELLGVDERSVRVIPHGVDEPFAPEGLAANAKYMLAVGTVEPRKNLDRLAEAARAEARGDAGGGTRPRHQAITDRRVLTRRTLWHWRGMLRFVRKQPERLRALGGTATQISDHPCRDCHREQDETEAE